MSEILIVPAFILAVNVVALASLVVYSIYRKVAINKQIS